jgi:microcystin-dependent protein
MVSTFTPNVQLEEPARGDDVGTWDTPVNNNMTLLDLLAGANTTIGLGSGNVTLSAGQFRSTTLTFNSTLVQNTTITFPTSFTKPYTVGHLCSASSAFTISLQTTAAGGQAIAIPPGEYVSVFNDGANLKFMNLERVGTYWDYAGGGVPAWITACTVPPYLNCDGTTFSSATYPQLAVIMGGNTLPDTRGRFRLALNQGTGRVTTANGGVDGNTNYAVGGAPNHTLTVAELPTGIQSAGTSPSANVVFSNQAPQATSATGGPPAGNIFPLGSVQSIGTLVLNVTSNNTSGGSHFIMDPTYVGGITMVRAA